MNMSQTEENIANAAADEDISHLPRRRTDGARIADLAKYNVKLYTKDGGSKLIRRCVLGHLDLSTSQVTNRLNEYTHVYYALWLCFTRNDGRIERQFRLNIGKLPVAYKQVKAELFIIWD